MEWINLKLIWWSEETTLVAWFCISEGPLDSKPLALLHGLDGLCFYFNDTNGTSTYEITSFLDTLLLCEKINEIVLMRSNVFFMYQKKRKHSSRTPTNRLPTIMNQFECVKRSLSSEVQPEQVWTCLGGPLQGPGLEPCTEGDPFMARSNALWVTVTWDPLVDRQTWLKTSLAGGNYTSFFSSDEINFCFLFPLSRLHCGNVVMFCFPHGKQVPHHYIGIWNHISLLMYFISSLSWYARESANGR